jgi:hypothetical protein
MSSYCRQASVYADGPAMLVVAESGVAFAFTRGSRCLSIVGEDDVEVAKSARRVVQDLVRLTAWSRGIAIVEASAVAVPGEGALVVVGGPRAGKTVMLTRLLRTGVPGFIGNDEVMLDPGGDRVTALGSPVHVMIRPWLADRFNELSDVAAALRASGAAKHSLHYPEFASRFGARVCPTAPVASLVFLEDGNGIRPASGREVAAHLSASRLWDDRWDTPWRALHDAPPGPPVAETLTRLARACPAVRVGRETDAHEVMALARP